MLIIIYYLLCLFTLLFAALEDILDEAFYKEMTDFVLSAWLLLCFAFCCPNILTTQPRPKLNLVKFTI